MHKKIDWWWFLFWAGIVLPWIYFLLSRHTFVFAYINELFVTGLNPWVVIFMNVLPVLFVVLVFKILGRLKVKNIIPTLVYCLAGALFTFFIIKEVFPFRTVYPNPNMARRYIDYSGNLDTGYTVSRYFYITANAIILLLFFYFFTRNFPRQLKEKHTL